jgi:CheY-like chemotaxis protein
VTVDLESANRLKDELLETLAHELRTPLNAMLGWAELLLSRTSEDADARRGLTAIARNARAQAKLLDELLDANRIVSGKVRLDVGRLELRDVVEAAIDAVRPTARAKGLALRTQLETIEETADGDPHRVQQIVGNLLSNAVKFTPRGGAIDVALRRAGTQAEISIADTGVGIAPQVLPHVFDPLRPATRRQGGLGLGLAIVRQLVELHGGSVRAESAGLERGATFVVALPLRAVRDDAARMPEPTGHLRAARLAEISLAGLSVLVIDDEADALALLELVLGDAGARVAVAGSSEAALAKLAAARPDVIVSDIGMPERDGYQLMRSIRMLPPERGGRTPAVALTAFARSEDRTRALLAGYQVHMTKPIEPLELIVTIASLTGRT